MLQGKAIRLRKVIPSDLERYLQWLSDPEVARLILGTVIPISTKYVQELIDRSPDACFSEILFAIETIPEGKHVGFCFLKNVHPIHRCAELEQLFIGDQESRSNGYGQDSIETLLTYCFSELNLNRIWLITYSYNKKAIHLYSRCGFEKEGTLGQVQFTRGDFQDGIIMAILRKDWEAKSPNKYFDSVYKKGVGYGE